MRGTPEERFWKYVKKTDTCWLWTGAKTKTIAGYGALGVAGKVIRAHRYSYELHIGPIPDGLFVLHHCDVPLCVNPTHLFLGTDKDNAIDRENKDRGTDNRGEKHWKAELTEVEIRKVFQDFENGLSRREIADKYGRAKPNIDKILNKKRWKHLW